MTDEDKAPWHERWPLLGRGRNGMRDGLFRLIDKVLRTDDGREMAARSLQGLLPARADWQPPADALAPPYADLGRAATSAATCLRSDPIIITARFRSGSTLLWNLFRQLDGFTSYYEPLNERRWFDPAARGSHTDKTHKNAEEYWREYDGLAELGKFFRADWHERHLYMDADFWDPDLRRYVEVMVERAPGRPVLQFNRIDFRLPWFRKNFPNAKYVHLYRHPRDQWCSALMDVRCFGPESGDMAAFAPHDKFYLRAWCRDLRYHFPFLDERCGAHPYALFYFVWKLSYLFGVRHCHHSVAFEQLVTEPDAELTKLFAAVGVAPGPLDRLKAILVKPALGKWKEYAADAWFRRHEEACEETLADFFRAS